MFCSPCKTHKSPQIHISPYCIVKLLQSDNHTNIHIPLLARSNTCKIHDRQLLVVEFEISGKSNLTFIELYDSQGCKIKMDDSGNILIKRIAKANVLVKIPDSENAVSNEIVKLPHGSLELDKPVKLFDMKKFQQNVARELKRAYPDRRKLECQVRHDTETVQF